MARDPKRSTPSDGDGDDGSPTGQDGQTIILHERDPGAAEGSSISASDATRAPRTTASFRELRAPLADILRARVEHGEGARLRRYTLLRVLGQGGMGIVFAAYDEELDRKVAIKLLRDPDPGSPFDASWILGEAKAMARLSHPNVVQVYDLGEEQGQIFVAMEYVVGVTLSEWLRLRPRSWREIVEVFVGAGRGLKAVHDAGIIHRDFKPQNVLVGENGRVRVLDFGLSHPGEPLAIKATTSASSPSINSGHLSGTPAYIAPEIYLSDEADVRSDIFAFCVTLYECLFGGRPFAGKTLVQVRRAIVTEEPRPPPEDSRAPAWLRKTIARGLQRDPELRWQTMDELLGALERDRARTARRALSLAALVTIAGLAGANVYQRQHHDEEAAARRCAELGETDPAWAGERRDAAKAAILGSNVPYATTTWDRVAERLDHYAGELGAQRSEACTEHDRGGSSDTLYDLRLACLDRHARDLRAATELLQAADDAAVERAVKIASELRPLDDCASTESLVSGIAAPDDPTLAAAVEDHRDELRRALVTFLAGRQDEALAAVDTLVARAIELDYTPLVAESHALRGRILERTGDYEASRDALMAALWAAEASRYDDIALEASVGLLLVEGYHLAKIEAADRWDKLLTAITRRSGGPGAQASRIETVRGALAIRSGSIDAGLESFERAKAAALRVDGPKSIDLVTAVANIGMARSILDEHDAALRALAEANEIAESIFGKGHPEVVRVTANLAAANLAAGRVEAAIVLFEEALELNRRNLQPNHPDVARSLQNLATAHVSLGRFPAARQLYEEALARRTQALGEDHPDTAVILLNLSSVHRYLGEPATAQAYAERAIRVLTASVGEDHRNYAIGLVERAANHQALGDTAAAIADAEAAIARYESVESPPRAQLGHAQSILAIELSADPGATSRSSELARAAFVNLREARALDQPEGRQLLAWLRDKDPEFDTSPTSENETQESAAAIPEGKDRR